mgnify:CR=1 FL=1
MADNTNIIVVGNVAFTDQGTWQSGYSYQDEDGQTVKGYDEGDIVHTSSGVFASLEDGNTTTPSDTNAKWSIWSWRPKMPNSSRTLPRRVASQVSMDR